MTRPSVKCLVRGIKLTSRLACLSLIVAAIAPTTAHALSGTVNAPPTVVGSNQTLESNSTLNVNSGGSVGLAFRAGSTTNPETNQNIVVNINGGNVGDVFHASNASTINISGGTVGSNFYAHNGSKINITGGSIGPTFRAESGSIVKMSGGTVAGTLNAFAGSQWTLSGGVLGQGFITFPDSAISLLGGEFLLNGSTATSTVTLGETDVLSGTLEDGTPVIFSRYVSDHLYDAALVPKSLPAASTAPITVNSGTSPLKGLRAGQQLTLGGGTLANNFTVVNATLNVNSGTVGYGLEAVGSTLNITGGTFGNVLNVYRGTTANISGGSIGQRFNAFSGSNVNISGGKFDIYFKAHPASIVNISGGVYAHVNAAAGSAMTLHGGEFLLNGATPTSPVSLNLFDVFTGTLADGSVFIVPKLGSDPEFAGVALANHALPLLDLTPKTISTTSTLQGLRAGQSLTLNTGGQLPTYFNAVGATMKVTGGTIGRGMKAVNSNFTLTSGTIGFEPSLYSNSTFTMTGGTVGESLALINSTAYISGGTVDQYLRPIYSTVTINGGTIGDNLSVVSSTVNFRGGTTGLRTSVHSGSVFNWSGGTPGVDFSATPGGTINIYGTQFNYGPTDLNSLLTLNTPYPLTLRSTIVHGMLANGQSFGFDTRQSPATAMINLILVIPGDFNFDGAVDSADYVTWRKGLGTTYTATDYNTWRFHFGQTAASVSAFSAAIPEPATTMPALTILVMAAPQYRRAKSLPPRSAG